MTELNIWEEDQQKFSYEQGMEAFQELQKALKKLVKKLRQALKGMRQTLLGELRGWGKDAGKLIRDAFTLDSLADYETAAAIYGEALAASVYQLQVCFAQLKLAIVGAAAPIVQVLVPAVRMAVEAVTGLINSLGMVLRTLLLGQEEAEGFSSAMTGAATAGGTLKRYLAGFDQINRLSGKTGSGGIFAVNTLTPLTGIWKKLADTLTEMLRPLKELDLSPAAESLKELKKAIEPLTRTLFAGLEWAWYNLFVPLAQWTVEELLPVFLDTLNAALQALARVIEELKPAFLWLWESCLKPLAQWAGDQVIAYLQGITQELNGVSGWIQSNQGPLGQLLISGKGLIAVLAQTALETLGLSRVTDLAKESLAGFLLSMLGAKTPFAGTTSAISGLLGSIQQLAEGFGLVDGASNSTWQALKSVWEGAWSWLKEKTVDPAYSGVKNAINGIIGFINGLLKGLTTGLNFLAGSMNKMSITIPDWIPVLGGKSMSFGMQTFTAPQIPYLARGAVLPANKPFLAVVGDQKHGTNVEAPLATIQEAVAAVMQDNISAMLTGFQALLEENRLLRSAVESIELADETIAAAVDRHQRKMAVVWGGAL